MRFALILFVAVVTLSCYPQDKSPIITQEFNLDEFTSFDLAMAADVIILEGSTQKVEITGPTETIKEINQNVNSGHWKISLPNSHRMSYRNLTITITSSKIEGIAVLGSGNVSSKYALPLKTLSISGSGTMDVNARSSDLSCKISGSGHMNLYGSANSLNQSISGSGSFNSYDLESRETEVAISGSGSSKTSTSDRLIVSISGSGSVYYKGNPSIEQRISGSGNVIDAN